MTESEPPTHPPDEPTGEPPTHPAGEPTGEPPTDPAGAPGAVAPPGHPLLASEVIARSGMDPAPSEAALWADCPICGRHQSLAEAQVEPAEDPQDITAYRCAAGCTVLVVTGHPNPVPLPGSGRYRLGDLAVAPLVESGLLINLPSGREVRLTPNVRLY